ncbi:MAG: NlpC/P60 family protein [Saprospiraceae bacterium]|nr:NlpC/P60 family protein [Saprospiraceae bacterium]
MVNRAGELLGVKWTHQGRHPQYGLDCAGLAIECALAAGIEVIAPTDYGRKVDQDYLISFIQAHCAPIQIDSIEPGDLLLMAFQGVSQHLAIYVGDDWFIHSYEKQGVVKQQLIPFWRKKVTHAFRLS